MRKVVHLITGLDIGGTEQMLLTMAPKLNGHGLLNHVVALKGRGVIGKELEAKGIKVHYLDFDHLWDAPKSIVRFLRSMRKLKPDILVTYLVHADIFGRLFGSIVAGIPKSIVYRRGPYLQWEFLSRFDRWTSGRVAKYLVVSNWLKRELEGKGFEKHKIQVLGNSVDTDFFDNLPVKTRAEAEVVLGMVANLKKGKGHLELIEALHRMQPLPTKLLLLGEGPERAVLEKRVRELGLKDKVIFLGFQRDVAQFLGSIDIFVLPTHFEGMSVALLQAMAAGKCIVTTDLEENRDVVTHGESALLVPPQNPEALAAALMTLVKNPAERKRLGDNAKKRCHQHFALDKRVSDFAAILKTL